MHCCFLTCEVIQIWCRCCTHCSVYCICYNLYVFALKSTKFQCIPQGNTQYLHYKDQVVSDVYSENQEMHKCTLGEVYGFVILKILMQVVIAES